MTVTVIVPSRGPVDRLRRLLDSLAAQSVEHETIVVDNASPGGAVARCCEEPGYGFATALELSRNAGFSAAVNLAARRASGSTLVLLNDDCVCEPSFVELIAAPIDAAGSVVMSAGVMRDARDPRRIDSAGMELDRTLLVYDYLNGEPVEVLADSPPDPIGPSAKAAALDRDAFLGAGGFDERLFAYWEDVDLVLRLAAAGGRCRLVPQALGTHEHSATLGSGSAAKNRLMGYGRGYVLRKWHVVNPRRAPGVLLRELVLVGGQAVIDRNLAGVRGRLEGWRAAEPSRRYPGELVAARGRGAGAIRGLARRWGRRRRLG
jgi:GT2 family glycosyltransferase